MAALRDDSGCRTRWKRYGKFATWESGKRNILIVAGLPVEVNPTNKSCIKVMTALIVPLATDIRPR
jgi:hypothetical protein